MKRGKKEESTHKIDGDVFCLMPWISIHITMNGDVFTCCAASIDIPLGSLHSERIVDIWNGNKMRDFRKNILQGQKSPICAKCYEQEASGFRSLRNSANANFAHHMPIVNQTHQDGKLADLNIRFLDIRFSNVCNFACRTCGPSVSTAWYPYVKDSTQYQSVIRAKASGKSLLKELEPLLGKIEQIYFAGGEPMLMPEHYELLELILSQNRQDIHLSYSTNFSVLHFKQWDLLKLWQRFEHVTVSASLDGSGARGEYIRRGLKWNQVIKNHQSLLLTCPHVLFEISSTLSIFNSLHLPDFHQEWVELGLINPEQLNINILQNPVPFRLTTLPTDIKKKVRNRYARHIDYLAEKSNCKAVRQEYESAIRFMYSKDTSYSMSDLHTFLREQDKARQESFLLTFPELIGLQYAEV